MVWGVSLGLGLGIVVMVLGLALQGRHEDVANRLSRFGSESLTLEEREMSVPFIERILLPMLRRLAGAVYRLKLAPDGRSITGKPIEYFKTTNRYRDLAISPDGRRIFISTDDHGVTQGDDNKRSNTLANPGAILEFTYVPPAVAARQR